MLIAAGIGDDDAVDNVIMFGVVWLGERYVVIVGIVDWFVVMPLLVVTWWEGAAVVEDSGTSGKAPSKNLALLGLIGAAKVTSEVLYELLG